MLLCCTARHVTVPRCQCMTALAVFVMLPWFAAVFFVGHNMEQQLVDMEFMESQSFIVRRPGAFFCV